MKTFCKKVARLGRDISSLRITVYSGNATFFLLLSVFPAAMLLLTALQYIPASVEDLVDFLSDLTPEPVAHLLAAVFYDLEPGRTLTVLSATALATVWTFTRAMLSLMYGLDAVNGTTRPRPAVKKWLISFLSAVLFFAAILATLLLQVFGENLYTLTLAGHRPELNLLASVLQLRSLFSVGFLTLVFSLFYSTLPARRSSFRCNLPGAFLAALGWLIYSALFGLYVENFSKYSMIYGSITAIVVTMLWLYFCMNLLFYGCLFNRFLSSSAHPYRRLAAYFRQPPGGI